MHSVFFAVLLFVAATTTAAGQVDASGEIAGRITDREGNGLPGVRIAVTGGGDVREDAVTDSHGRFRIGPLRPGTYRVDARLDGFFPASGTLTLSEPTHGAYLAWSLELGCLSEDVIVKMGPREAAPTVDAILHLRVTSAGGPLLWSRQPQCEAKVVESYTVDVLDKVQRAVGGNAAAGALPMFLPRADARLRTGGEYVALLWAGGLTDGRLVLPVESGRISPAAGEPLAGMPVAEALRTLARWRRGR